VIVPVAIVVVVILLVEAARWLLRPEARRLRVLKKIGRR
jgi:hypothetical protein